MGGETVTIDDELPVGAQCWADESDQGGAIVVDIDHGTLETAVWPRQLEPVFSSTIGVV